MIWRYPYFWKHPHMLGGKLHLQLCPHKKKRQDTWWPNANLPNAPPLHPEHMGSHPFKVFQHLSELAGFCHPKIIAKFISGLKKKSTSAKICHQPNWSALATPTFPFQKNLGSMGISDGHWCTQLVKSVCARSNIGGVDPLGQQKFPPKKGWLVR